MLAGVHDDLLGACGNAGAVDGREFGEVGAGTNDVEKLHEGLVLGRLDRLR